MSLVLALLLAVSGHAAPVAGRAARPGARPPLLLPGGALGPRRGLTLPPRPSLILPERRALIVPEAPRLLPPEPLLTPAARAMTAEEARPRGPLAAEELRALADSLAGGAPAGPTAPAAGGERAPEHGRTAGASAFDGAPLRDAELESALAYLAGPAEPASLAQSAAAARAVYGRLLPRLDRRVPIAVVQDEIGENAHSWKKDRGHRIHVAAERADARGEVASAAGMGARVQQKIARLVALVHERAHAVFDDLLPDGPRERPAGSVYMAMTEGFALTVERLVIDGLLGEPERWRLSPRDSSDLLAIARGRRDYLLLHDTHYAEGDRIWRAVLEGGGQPGARDFAARLSSARMAELPRSDPAYQLALGDPELLSSYLGADPSARLRRGLEAYARAARGEELAPGEAAAAAEAIERAGPEGRQGLFERSLMLDRAIEGPSPGRGERWWRDDAGAAQVAAAFALARLSPAGAAELAAFLARHAAAAPERLLGAGALERNARLIEAAERLPWTGEERSAWLEALSRWLRGR